MGVDTHVLVLVKRQDFPWRDPEYLTYKYPVWPTTRKFDLQVCYHPMQALSREDLVRSMMLMCRIRDSVRNADMAFGCAYCQRCRLVGLRMKWSSSMFCILHDLSLKL